VLRDSLHVLSVVRTPTRRVLCNRSSELSPLTVSVLQGLRYAVQDVVRPEKDTSCRSRVSKERAPLLGGDTASRCQKHYRRSPGVLKSSGSCVSLPSRHFRYAEVWSWMEGSSNMAGRQRRGFSGCVEGRWTSFILYRHSHILLASAVVASFQACLWLFFSRVEIQSKRMH